jgi:hypothetical protein
MTLAIGWSAHTLSFLPPHTTGGGLGLPAGALGLQIEEAAAS